MRKLKITELNRISVEEFKEAEKLPLVVVLDNIRSLHNIGSVFPLLFPVFKGKCHQLFFLGKHLDLSTKSIVSRFLISGFPLGGRLISASVYKGICQIRSHDDQNHDQDPEPENAVFPFHLFRHLSALLPQ